MVASAAPGPFRLPLSDTELFVWWLGVDHDPSVDEAYGMACVSYDGRNFPWCYDEHDGTDYIMTGGFEKMDAGSSPIVAAADGVVVETVDGNYDRCHGGQIGEVDCDGHEMRANYVILEHAGGIRTWYWHLKRDSVAVSVGEEVLCGQPLGLVGSSGRSAMPHLHFEVKDGLGQTIDPYAGPYSGDSSWWVEQGDIGELPTTRCADF